MLFSVCLHTLTLVQWYCWWKLTTRPPLWQANVCPSSELSEVVARLPEWRSTLHELLNHHHHHRHHLSLNREGRWGTTDDFATSFLHFCLFSTALLDLANSRPVHSLMLSSHLFLCPPCLLPPFTVPCKMVLARPAERETRPYHCSLRLFTIVKRSWIVI